MPRQSSATATKNQTMARIDMSCPHSNTPGLCFQARPALIVVTEHGVIMVDGIAKSTMREQQKLEEQRMRPRNYKKVGEDE